MFGSYHVFVLATPKNVVATRQTNGAARDSLINRALRSFNISADIHTFDVDIDPSIRHGGFALDAHRRMDDLDAGQLPQRHLRARRRRDDDFAKRLEIFAKVAI